MPSRAAYPAWCRALPGTSPLPFSTSSCTAQNYLMFVSITVKYYGIWKAFKVKIKINFNHNKLSVSYYIIISWNHAYNVIFYIYVYALVLSINLNDDYIFWQCWIKENFMYFLDEKAQSPEKFMAINWSFTLELRANSTMMKTNHFLKW